jgi:hypothetical protein
MGKIPTFTKYTTPAEAGFIFAIKSGKWA